jgi:hypothetical protein
MGIETKTFAELLKEHTTAVIKCYLDQEMGPTRDLEDAQKQNKRINALGAALNEITQPGAKGPDGKTY